MVLRIPSAGLPLESSGGSAKLPSQAFAITLDNSVIENMIECVQNGLDIQLSLGSSPALVYGAHTHRLTPPPDTFPCDLYCSDPSAAEIKAERLPNPVMAVFDQKLPYPVPPREIRLERSRKTVAKGSKGPEVRKVNEVQNTFAGKADKADDALEKLKNAFAQHEEKKQGNSATLVSGVIPTSKNGKVVGKVLSGGGNTARSMPTSPALSGVGSPSLGPTGHMSDKVKRQRAPVIHELAVAPRRFSVLLNKFQSGNRQEFKVVLDKVAVLNPETDEYELKKMCWKELDVFDYSYDNEEDRSAAIENAVKVYDRLRLGPSEPEWDRLLPKEERGKGKCLSKLQAQIAKNAAGGQTLKVPKTEGSSGSPESGSSKEEDRPNKATGGQAMVRSISQPVGATSKKVSEREVQAKRLLSNAKKPAAQKASTPKVSPVKATQKGGAKEKGGRVLSKEFISDSDESDDEDVPLSVKNQAKTQVAEKSKVTAAPPPKAKPAPKPAPTKTEAAARPSKRPREEDDSSSSGTPLSKRLKPKEVEKRVVKKDRKELKPTEPGVKAAVSAPVLNNLKQRPSDSSQHSRTTSSGGVSFAKSKNTSPTKSSPLASSPPTNASDLEPPQQETIVAKPATAGMKRKTDDKPATGGEAERQHAASNKRARPSPAIVSKAQKYRLFYPKYEEMHYRLVKLADPPADMIQDLLDMRDRLEKMKAEIYKEVAPV